MPKRKLDRCYIFRGVHFGPGLVDIPQELDENIKAREAIAEAKEREPEYGYPADFPNADLLTAGGVYFHQLEGMTEKDLTVIEGIGPARAAAIINAYRSD